MSDVHNDDVAFELTPDEIGRILGRDVGPDPITDLANGRTINGALACAAAMSLREILPFAEQEVAAIHDVVKRDGDEDAEAAARVGDAAIERARNTLRATDRALRPTEHLPVDHYDNTIQCYLDETLPTDDAVVETIAQALIREKEAKEGPTE